MPTPALEHARGVADAVLYEGYLLYPYRRSSGKNRVRFQFGVLAPRRWIDAQASVVDGVAGSTESWWQQTEVLLEPPRRASPAAEPSLTVRLRFLQMQDKQVELRTRDGGYTGVPEMQVDGARHLSFSEAVPHETDLEVPVVEGERSFPIVIDGGSEVEPLREGDGSLVGRVRRTRRPLAASVSVSLRRREAPFPLLLLTVLTENVADEVDASAPREAALRHALIATHTVLGGDGLRFVSLLEPPAWANEAVRACCNVRSFPVLVGAAGARDVMLSSPIILYDHPQIAPESPGDLHDAAEIDEILSLRTLTLSEDEKREVRGTDPRGAAILDRVERMPPEVLERLHGAVRELRPSGGRADQAAADDQADDFRADDELEPAWWEPGGDAEVSPETDTVAVDGVVLGRGSRVRLRPAGRGSGRRGSDAHDMFLVGRTARIEKVLLDVDGSRFLAVAVEDEGGVELDGPDLREWYGRFRHFRPDEVEPLDESEVEQPGEPDLQTRETVP